MQSKLDLYCLGNFKAKYDTLKTIKKKERKPGVIIHSYEHISKGMTSSEIKEAPYQQLQTVCTYTSSQMNFEVALLLKDF
jgi:hypothetical protein